MESMRSLAVLLATAVFVACSPREIADPTPQPRTATATAPATAMATSTVPMGPAATPANTRLPTATPTVTPIPHLQFDIDESVPATERGLISIGIRLADEYAAVELGGAVERPILVQVATEGVCIGGASAVGYRICFNAASPNWLALEPDYLKLKIASHEYFHVWQHELFCYREPKWLFEGLAEWFGYRVIVEEGLVEQAVASAARQQVLQGAPILEPLADQEVLYAAPQPNQYALWSFAAERLMVRHSAGAIRGFCAGNREGLRWQEAFEDAFGEPVDDFYASFEEWRAGFLPYSAP
jgi:hypothetical protein